MASVWAAKAVRSPVVRARSGVAGTWDSLTGDRASPSAAQAMVAVPATVKTAADTEMASRPRAVMRGADLLFGMFDSVSMTSFWSCFQAP